MATTTVTFNHDTASQCPLKSSDTARQALRKVVTLCEGLAGGSYKGTDFIASQDSATGTVTLDDVGGVAASGSVALSGVGGTAASGSLLMSGVGGTAATGSVALLNVGGEAATGTVTMGSNPTDVQVTLNGEATAVLPGGVSNEETAQDLADEINSEGTYGALAFSASALGAVCTITAAAKGTAGNVTLSSTAATGTATSSGANLTGGADGSVTVVINGTSIGPTDTTNISDTAAATAVAAAIEADGTIGPQIAAVGNVADVELTWSAKGTAGNVTLTSSATSGTATASGATLTGGVQGSVGVTINGTLVTTNTTNISDAASATAVAAAIEANGTLGPLLAAVADAENVDITWGVKGTVGNAVTFTSTTATGTTSPTGSGFLTLGAQGSVGITLNGTLVTTDTTTMTDSAAATACAAAIEANGTLGPLVAATGDSADVDLVWSTKGTVGNAITLSATSATGTATRSGATLASGANCNTTVTVAGNAIVTNTTNLSNSAAATAVAAALNADATVATYILASAASAVVTLTADVVGPVGNAIPFSSTADSGTATASGSFLSGGTSTTYTL